MCLFFQKEREDRGSMVSPMGEHARFFFALSRTDDGDE